MKQDGQARSGGIRLNLVTDGAATGHFDPDRLGQAIDNLISNAIKNTNHGGTVTVKVGATGHELRCEVTDTGVGMTEEELDHAFTRFFRAAKAHSSNIPGAGLGLAITKSIMENHRGHVVLSSTPGQGTTAAADPASGRHGGRIPRVPFLSAAGSSATAATEGLRSYPGGKRGEIGGHSPSTGPLRGPTLSSQEPDNTDGGVRHGRTGRCRIDSARLRRVHRGRLRCA